jgi:hypothetical protein
MFDVSTCSAKKMTRFCCKPLQHQRQGNDFIHGREAAGGYGRE